MNCIHSFWTGTPRFAPERGPLLVHTLSLALAHEHFQHVEIVTDTRGLQLAEAFGWRYTAYLNALDRMPGGGKEHIWALGKLYSVLEQTEPFVQIDTDVLLYKALRRELRHARLVAQSIDYMHHYTSRDMQRAMDVAGFRFGRVAYNCGVIGGCDLNLLHRYAEKALKLAENFIVGTDAGKLNGTAVSMLIEQYFLGEFARRNHCRVDTVVPLNYGRRERDAAGYDHLVGQGKRDAGEVAKCEALLARDYPAEYRRFLDGWAQVSREDATVPLGAYGS